MKIRPVLLILLFVVVTSFSANSFAEGESRKEQIAEQITKEPWEELSREQLMKKIILLLTAYELLQGEVIVVNLKLLMSEINNQEFAGTITPQQADEFRATTKEALVAAEVQEAATKKSFERMNLDF
ncbi:MAG: hypothetical protein QGH85_01640 [Candidatus Pacebacteria bacterium]|nr:hypothetical protein [Candidatus Paceibacterota bacterium]MDP7648122.1 hypothetical protein [Candidatus Paceibacterota bacterium]